MSERAALIVVDMLNRYEHEDAEPLMASVREALPKIERVLEWASRRRLSIVYVNDNYGEWDAGGSELCQRALQTPNGGLVQPILPPSGAAFVPKARHSIFYETPLDYLLRSEDIERLLVVGQVTEQCILYSALDAYVRHYRVTVVQDAVAHIHSHLAQAALQLMRLNMRAQILDAESLIAA